MSDKLRVDLHGAPATMLATLYAKALDADAPKSLLHDTYARDIVDRIDYNWAATTITAKNAPSVTLRSAHFDNWTRQFLRLHPDAVVLHLGCGLDSRFLRVAPGPGIDWYDVDYPEVIALRERFYPPHPKHHVVAASVTDPAWPAEIPDGRPTLMVAEGLTMYLDQDDGIALLRRIVDRFPSGEMQFDAFNWLGIKTQWSNAVVRRSGSTLYWAINGPYDILAAVPGTRLLQWVPVFEVDAFTRIGGGYRLMAAVMNRIPGARTMAQFHRYAY
ncbi:class I SAM-dependent methyltransferase [Mycolicibacterium sp. CR10]|uniref:class I SAM-dependent methyltransferase n=1 Tax=Mycolicibacterium sp. CR10 TaxID=2562314 RepID=UPI001F11490A|nr:class I SAM-dependent methyltransferase [Mycolicibacterium sp. CR10]